MGVIEEVGASARTLLARFTSGIKAGQRVVAAPWPAAEGQGTPVDAWDGASSQSIPHPMPGTAWPSSNAMPDAYKAA